MEQNAAGRLDVASPEANESRGMLPAASIERPDIGALYDAHARALVRFAARASGMTETTEIVRSTFVRAALVRRADEGASVRAWLFGLAAQVLAERGGARRVLQGVWGRRSRGSADSAPLIERGLSELSRARRLVIVLAEVESFSCAEISTMLGAPLGTVWERLHHARKQLRPYLEEVGRRARGPRCLRSWEVEAARDGRLDGEAREAFDAHREQCTRCADDAAYLEDLAEALAAMEVPEPDDRSMQQLREALAAPPQAPLAVSRLRAPTLLVVLSVAALALLVFFLARC